MTDDAPEMTKLSKGSRAFTTGMIGHGAGLAELKQPTAADINSFRGDSLRFDRKMRRMAALKEAASLIDSSDEEPDDSEDHRCFEQEEAALLAAYEAERFLSFTGDSARFSRRLRRERSIEQARIAESERGWTNALNRDRSGDLDGSIEEGGGSGAGTPEASDGESMTDGDHGAFQAEEDMLVARDALAEALAARVMRAALDAVCGARPMVSGGPDAADAVSLRGARRMRREQSIDEAWGGAGAGAGAGAARAGGAVLRREMSVEEAEEEAEWRRFAEEEERLLASEP